MKRLLYNNGLSIILLVFFLFSLAFQVVAGYHLHNKERIEEGLSDIGMGAYLHSGHFLQATFENWESEFLQMGLFVILTIFLRQKGSSESKKCEGTEEVDREPSPNKPGAPWAVKKGGWILKIYKHSLSIALILLFVISFILHFHGSLKDENEKRLANNESIQTWKDYIFSDRLWFESLQNWQSEFFSVFALIVLSIYLRQIGSPQSKPVDAPHDKTGID